MPEGLRIVLSTVASAPLGLYSLSVVAFAVTAPFNLRRSKRLYPASSSEFDRLSRNLAGKKLSAMVTSFLLSTQRVIAWPVGLEAARQFRSRASDFQFDAWRQLKPGDQKYAVFAASVLSATVLLSWPKLIWFPLLKFVPILVLAGSSARHASYLIGGLAERLRRSEENPIKVVVVIAVGDAVALLQGSYLLLYASIDVQPSFDLMRATTLSMIAFREPKLLLHDSISKIAVAVIASLFYTSVIKTLLTVNSYRRNGLDYSRVAFSLVALGRPKEARRWSLRDTSATPESFSTRAAIELADNRFADAMHFSSAYQRAKGESDASDASLQWLTGLFLIIRATASAPEFSFRFFDNILRNGASDANIYIVLNYLLVTRLVDPNSLEVLKMRIGKNQYPLSYSLLLNSSGNGKGALSTLLESASGSDIEGILRALLLSEIYASDSAADDKQRKLTQQDWVENVFPIIEAITPDLPRHWKRAAATAIILRGADLYHYDPEFGRKLWNLAVPLALEVMTKEEFDNWLKVGLPTRSADRTA